MKTQAVIFFSIVILLIGFYIIRTKGNDLDINTPLPLKMWTKNNNDLPIIFYLSGDAGIGPFSSKICTNLHQNGYDVYALNSKVYYWNKQDPKNTSEVISQYLKKIFKNHSNQKLIFIGYSFGSDVLPFIINNLPKNTKNRIENIILLDPYESADFEIYYKNLIFESVSGQWQTIPAINQLPPIKLSIILSDYGEKYPYNKINHQKNIIHLGGNHHFNRNYKLVTKTILNQIEKY